MSKSTTHGGWLLVTVTTAGATPGLRVTVWRKLKALGAHYLQQSVSMLPDLPEVAQEIAVLRAKVDRDGGHARVLRILVADAAQEEELKAQMRAARDEEYGEVLDRLPSFFEELAMETARGRTTFEEVEESEADLARFQAWIGKIGARDYFDAPEGARVRAELARAEIALEGFVAVTLEAEQPDFGSTGPAVKVSASSRRGALRPVDP